MGKRRKVINLCIEIQSQTYFMYALQSGIQKKSRSTTMERIILCILALEDRVVRTHILYSCVDVILLDALCLCSPEICCTRSC